MGKRHEETITDGKKIMKVFSILIAVREIQIKSTRRYHYTPIRYRLL